MELDWVRLGAAIRQARHEQGLTMNDLANKASIARASLHNLESGRPSHRMPPSMSKVAEVLGWPADRPMAILQRRDLLETTAPSEKELSEDDISQAVLAAVVATTDLTAMEIRAISDRVIASLKQRGLL